VLYLNREDFLNLWGWWTELLTVWRPAILNTWEYCTVLYLSSEGICELVGTAHSVDCTE